MNQTKFLTGLAVMLTWVISCAEPVSNSGPLPPSHVLIDTSAVLKSLDHNVSNRSTDVLLELGAYARADRGWSDVDEAALRSEFKAATLSGTAVPFEMEVGDLNGRKDARRVRVHYSIPQESTVVAGWFGSVVQRGGASEGYDAPPQTLGADGSDPGLTFVQTAASCPRVMAIDIGGGELEHRLTLRFSEDVQLQPKADASIEVHVFGVPNKVTKQEPLGVTQDSAREVSISLTRESLPGADLGSIALNVEDFVPGVSGFADQATCGVGSQHLKLTTAELGVSGRRWLHATSTFLSLAFDHESAIAKHPEYRDAK